MTKNFKTTILVSFLLVLLVIFAGSMVRMTGSGMGCPDFQLQKGSYDFKK